MNAFLLLLALFAGGHKPVTHKPKPAPVVESLLSNAFWRHTVLQASQVAMGQYNSTPITLANGQRAALQLDANGNLKVTSSGGGGSTVITTPGLVVTYSISNAQTSGTIIPETTPTPGNTTDTTGYYLARLFVTAQGGGSPTFSLYTSPDNTNFSLAQYTKSTTTALTPYMASMSSTVGSSYTGATGKYSELKLTSNQSSGTTTVIAMYYPLAESVTMGVGGVGTQNSPTLGNPLYDGLASFLTPQFVSDGALSGQRGTQYGSLLVSPGLGQNPNQDAFYNNSSGSATGIVTAFDINGKSTPFVDTNAVKWPNVTITLSATTAYSLGYLVQQSMPDSTHPIVGIPATAAYVYIQWTSTNTGDIRANGSGTIDGTSGAARGIDSSLVAPNSTSPVYMLPGGLYPIWSPFQVGDPIGLATAVVQSQSIPNGATPEKNSSNGSPITTATTVQIYAAAGSGLYHHTWFKYVNGGSTGTEVQILDGSTVIDDFYAPPNGGGLSDAIPIPLVGSANATLSIKVLTAGASIYWSARGFYSATAN